MMSRLFTKQRGWTMIELMIVVIIIGVIAALAVPRFLTASTSTKQSEAKLLLKQIYQAERSYFQEYDTYWIPGAAVVAGQTNRLAFAPIGVNIAGPARYSYTIVGDRLTFVATATCGILDDDPTVDQWQIDQDGVLTAISDDHSN